MATTAVFAEILIVGFQVEAWLLLLLFNIFGTEWIDFGDFRDWESLVTVLVLATAYVLGILIDRVADSLLGDVTKRLCEEGPTPVAKMRLLVMAESEGMAKFLDYQRSRLRIARATLLNVAIALPNAVIFLSIRADQADDRVLAAGLLISAAWLLTLFAHRRISRAFCDRLEDAYEIVATVRQVKIAAAVCYQKRQGNVEFLLVKTKGRGKEPGKKWTFPKGHVKKGEAPARAAEREAEEEAGAIGKVEHAPLTAYLYSKARGTEVDLVAAHLFHVTHRKDAAEGFRAPQWFGAEETKRKLADRRERRYAREHERVVEAALEEIAGND